MVAAVTAAKRGHEVVLCEKGDKLGGMLNFTDSDSLKHDLNRYKKYLVAQTEKSNVKVMLNTAVTPELAEELNADDIIVAVGSTPVVPEYIKGFEKARHAIEIYNQGASGDDVVIIGGGLIGVEAGMHLKNTGKNVTVLELADDFARDARGVYKAGMLRKIEELGLNIITGAKCLEITDSCVVYEKDGNKCEVHYDSVFYAVGMKCSDELYFDLCGRGKRITIAGDCKKVGKVAGAVHGGFFAAMDIGRI